MFRRKKLISSIMVCFPILLASCAGEEEAKTPGGPITPQSVACSTHQAQFNTETWPILKANCTVCHKINGVNSDLDLLPDTLLNYEEANFTTFQKVAAKTDSSGVSLLVGKPINANNDHGGGKRLDVGSVEHTAIKNIVEKLSSCTNDGLKVADLDVGTGYQRLRKSTLALAGRLPTAAEEQQIDSTNGDATQQEVAFDTLLDAWLASSYFYERIKVIFNDFYLLDAFPGTRALGQFDLRNYTNENYYDISNLDPVYTPDPNNRNQRNTLRRNANQGLAQAPLELIAHVVREGRPFTEILTADYTMVNPYSATLYSATVTLKPGETRFQFQLGDAVDLNDANDFREAKITDNTGRAIPHAGLLTMPAFLRRYPSTNTNRNRARSRVTYSYFLNINVLGLASREGLDLDNVVGRFPTFEDPQCKACHDTVDPLAGLFKNWSNNGFYRGDFKNWPYKGNNPRILPPGFTIDAADELPNADSGKALQWLANRIAGDSGFARRVVEIMFRGLTGQELPEDFNFVESLISNFQAGNFNLKTLTKDIVRSPYFLAVNLTAQANPSEFSEIGMGRLLTPESLDRKIQTVTGGYRWRSPANKTLTDIATYRLLYGGIDSITVVSRTTTPTSLMAGVQQQIANETACNVVPADFNKSTGRVLFPLADITDIPDDAVGTGKIKDNIVHLIKQLWGQQVQQSSADVTRSYDLFVAVRDLTVGEGLPIDCRTGLNASNPVRIDTDRTVRPWMAVVTFLLADYQFFYE